MTVEQQLRRLVEIGKRLSFEYRQESNDREHIAALDAEADKLVAEVVEGCVKNIAERFAANERADRLERERDAARQGLNEIASAASAALVRVANSAMTTEQLRALLATAPPAEGAKWSDDGALRQAEAGRPLDQPADPLTGELAAALRASLDTKPKRRPRATAPGAADAGEGE